MKPASLILLGSLALLSPSGCVQPPPPQAAAPSEAPSTPEAAAEPTPAAPAPEPAAPAAPADLPPNPPLPTKFGLLMQPRLGQVFNNNAARAPIVFSGLHHKPAQAIEIQILSNPSDLASWVTIATTTSSTTIEPGTDADPMYPWSVEATPGADATRWPTGGVLRTRAMAGPERLVGLYHDSDACFAQVPGAIQAKARACASDFIQGIVLSSSASSPARDDRPPRYLREKEELSVDETLEYYNRIDAPATLADFRDRYDFDRNGTDEVRARYYNRGDLGIGRDMRCKSFAAGNNQTGVACYVENFGEFGGREDDALDLLQNGAAFATVAMVYTPPITADNAVQFVVYNAAGNLLTEAQLDTQGDNVSIPTNCLNCHGGAATYDRGMNVVRNARFLGFDVAAFDFVDRGGFRLADQEEAFRKLNQLIVKAEPTIATKEMVEGFYGGAAGLATANTVANARFVATAWRESSATAHVYEQVVAPYCRGCHVSQQKTPLAQDILDFSSSGIFLSQATTITSVVCGTAGDARSHTMPNAEATVDAFWRGPARAYLVAYLGAATACAP